jgi:uncharacterized protein
MSDTATAHATPARPIDESLFFALDPLQLAGSRCGACDTVAFPAMATCPCCSSVDVQRVALPEVGVLWSWTVQRIEPKRPYVAPAAGFEPYALGYVDVGEVLVESILVGAPDSFRIGERLRLVALPMPPDTGDSDPLITFAFGSDEAAR